ncbi:MAG TPA: hypothetical protein VJ935_07190 [Acidimicrobiia bacterium]|nr:hypothetical protein [Acidimicrobiia bacterium]
MDEASVAHIRALACSRRDIQCDHVPRGLRLANADRESETVGHPVKSIIPAGEYVPGNPWGHPGAREGVRYT